jgi:hypothetical protein
VRTHRFEFFYSRFAPDFTPDSKSNSIALHHTCSDRFTHRFNASVVHDLTPSHAIPIPTDRPFKARVLGSSSGRLTTFFSKLEVADLRGT